MKKNMLILVLIITLCIGFSSCKKDNVQIGGFSNSLVGKWSYPTSDNKGSYIGYYTFNNDGTMIVNDRNDVFNGVTTTYIYNTETKKLILGGIVVFQLIWISSKQFKYEGNGSTIVQRTFTKV